MTSALSPETRFLVAAERGGGVEAVVGVGPDDARTEALRHREDARALFSPHPRGEAVGSVVRLLDRLVRRPEREDRKDRPEDLLLRDAVRLRDAREDRRHEPIPSLGELARRLVDLSALVDPRLHERTDLVELLLRVDRTDIGVLIQRIADPERPHPALQLRHHGLIDRLLDEQSRSRAADVALIEVDAVDDPIDSLVYRGGVEDAVRRLASKLERASL